MTTPAIAPDMNLPPQASAISRVVNTFIAPTKAFAGLDKGKTGWWLAWLISAIVTVAFAFSVGKQVGWNQVVQNQIHSNQKMADQIEKAPAEQREKTVSIISTSFKVSLYGAPALSLLFATIFAAILLGTFNFGFGATIRFKTMFAIVIYGFLPYVLHALISIVTLFAGVDPEGFRVENPAATNVAAFLGTGISPALYRLASAIDIFNIWIIILLGIGVSMNSKVKRSTAILTVGIWYALVILAQAGLAALRS
jgi:uncharacterized protein YybS (DUF2232 family)